MDSVEQMLGRTRAKFESPAVVTYYDQLVAEGLFPFERHLIGQWAAPLLGRRVLDLGCGGGREALALALAGAQVVAVDLAPTMLEAARRNAERAGVAIDFVLSDCRNLSGFGCFDLVLGTNNFMEHIPSRTARQQVLGQIRRVCAAGGRIILSAHDRGLSMAKWGSFWQDQDERVRKGVEVDGYRLELGDKFLTQVCPHDPGDTPVYLHIYSREEMLEDLYEAGLTVVFHRSVPDLLQDMGLPMDSRFSSDVVYYVCERRRGG